MRIVQIDAEKVSNLISDLERHDIEDEKVKKAKDEFDGKILGLGPSWNRANLLGQQDEMTKISRQIQNLKEVRQSLAYNHFQKGEAIKSQIEAITLPYRQKICLEIMRMIKQIYEERNFQIEERKRHLATGSPCFTIRHNYDSIRKAVEGLIEGYKKIMNMGHESLWKIKETFDGLLEQVPDRFPLENVFEDAKETDLADFREGKTEQPPGTFSNEERFVSWNAPAPIPPGSLWGLTPRIRDYWEKKF